MIETQNLFLGTKSSFNCESSITYAYYTLPQYKSGRPIFCFNKNLPGASLKQTKHNNNFVTHDSAPGFLFEYGCSFRMPVVTTGLVKKISVFRNEPHKCVFRNQKQALFSRDRFYNGHSDTCAFVAEAY